MKRIWLWTLASTAMMAVLAPTAPAAERVMRLGGVGSNVALDPEMGATRNLRYDPQQAAETEKVWRRCYGGWCSPYVGWGGGWCGYRPWAYNYGWYRPYVYTYSSYYTPAYYGWGGWGCWAPSYSYYYAPCWYINNTPASTFNLSLPSVGVSVSTRPFQTDVVVPGARQLAPGRNPALAPNGSYPYDGGPANPVPMPKGGIPSVPNPPADAGENVTITAAYRVSAPLPAKKKSAAVGYSAYGEVLSRK